MKRYLEKAAATRRRRHLEGQCEQKARDIDILYCERLNHAEVLGSSWGIQQTKLGVQKVYASLWDGQ